MKDSKLSEDELKLMSKLESQAHLIRQEIERLQRNKVHIDDDIQTYKGQLKDMDAEYQPLLQRYRGE